MKKSIKLLVSVLLPLVVGAAGGVVTYSEIRNWYVFLNKPALVPPNGVFGPVWTILYILMGVALFLYWTDNSGKAVRKTKGYVIFGLQLILNFLWSWIFFGQHSPALAMLDIAALWIVILININMFYRQSKFAGWLLIPYLLLVSFAAYLNYGVWKLN